MRLHQSEQCMQAMVCLLEPLGIKTLKQQEIVHCIQRETQVESSFQFFGQRQQSDVEVGGMSIKIDRDVFDIEFSCVSKAARRNASFVVSSANNPK